MKPWSYPKLDGTIRERPINYYRLPDGRIVRLFPKPAEPSPIKPYQPLTFRTK